MPRKSKPAESDSNVDQRVTRRSLRSCVVDSPKKKEPSPSQSPAKVKSKGRASTSKNKAKVEETGYLEDEEEEDIDWTPKKSSKAVSPKGKKSGDEEKKTPSRSPRGRSPRSLKPESPSRKSSRGAAKVAAQKISVGEAESEDEEQMDESGEGPSQKGVKRKAEEADISSEEKRQKTDPVEAEIEAEETPLESEDHSIENKESKESEMEATPVPTEKGENVDKKLNKTEAKTVEKTQEMTSESKQENTEVKMEDVDVPTTDFVLVDKADVPAHESKEVQESLPTVAKQTTTSTDQTDAAKDNLGTSSVPEDQSQVQNTSRDAAGDQAASTAVEHQPKAAADHILATSTATQDNYPETGKPDQPKSTEILQAGDSSEMKSESSVSKSLSVEPPTIVVTEPSPEAGDAILSDNMEPAPTAQVTTPIKTLPSEMNDMETDKRNKNNVAEAPIIPNGQSIMS